jgi:hypothetical protein
MQKPEEDSPIEELAKELDTPGADLSGTFTRAGFHREIHDVETDWTHEHGNTMPILSRMRFTKKHKTLATWLFGAAVIFFLAALGTAAFFLTGDRNVLTADKIDIRVTGPTKVAAGEVLPLAIEIKNNNASTLQVADLLIEYPAGTRSAEDVAVPLLRVRMGLGDLAPGERAATTTEAVIFGKEGTKQNVIVSLEYRVAGSNAIFVKERAFMVEIDDSPVRLSIAAPSSLNSGNDVVLEIHMESNSSAPLENVILKADYPFGFEFASADPDPSFSQTLWSLGDLEPRGKRTVTLRGKLEGQQDEERIFRFEIGVAEQGGDITNIGTSFSNAEHTIRIVRPFVDISFFVDGETGETLTAGPGEDVELEIAWRNNLADRLADAVLELSIEGEGVNERSIKSPNGFYDSSRNILTWDKRSVQDFAIFEPGGTGRVNLSFLTLEADEFSGGIVNPDIRLRASLRAVPIGSRDTPELVRTDVAAVIRIITSVDLAATVVHGEGPIENSGPMPPKAETETTYTVVWDISSAVGDISSARVTAKLPPYVKWKGVIRPADEDVIYDPSTGLVTWNAGTVRAGAGYGKPARSLAFQIGLTPSVNQVGTAPTLIDDATLRATDSFAGVMVGDTEPELTTLLEDDSTFDQGDDRVKP